MLSYHRQSHKANEKSGGVVFQKQPLSLAATKSIPYAAAVQQQRYNCNRASSSFLCASSHGLYVRSLVHSRRSNHDNVFTPNATIKHTSSDLIPSVQSIQQEERKQLISHQITAIGTPAFTLFDLRRPRDMNSTPF